MEKILARINSINWSLKIQEKNIESAFCFDVLQNEQEKSNEEYILNFDDLLLNEKNRLTLFLHDKDRINYNKWNELASYYTSKITSLKFLEKKKEFTAFYKRLELILAMILMEEHYKLIQKKAPSFFIELLIFIENGYVPCGWDGDIIDDELSKFDFNSGMLYVLPIDKLNNH